MFESAGITFDDNGTEVDCCPQQPRPIALSCATHAFSHRHALIPRVLAAFQVYPSAISLGQIEVGQTYPTKVQVANVGAKPASFRVEQGNQRVADIESE